MYNTGSRSRSSPFSKPAAAARALPACHKWPIKKKKPKQKCEVASQLRGDTKLTALISVATPPTEFSDPNGACVMYSAALRSCQG